MLNKQYEMEDIINLALKSLSYGLNRKMGTYN